MNRQTIIVILAPGKQPETWGNFKKACETKGWKYNTLVRKKMPIEVGECKIFRTEFL